jgi:hypothetical protein
MKRMLLLLVVILVAGVCQCLASDGQVMVCVTSGKAATINSTRDLHVWIKNFGTSQAAMTLRFFVDGKGTNIYHVVLGPQEVSKKTRNESWMTTGTRKLTARVEYQGGGQTVVNGAIRIDLLYPSYESGRPVVCSDNKSYRESELFQHPPGPTRSSTPLPLLLCVSNGKNPPVYGDRDIHAWVTNRGQSAISGLKLSSWVTGKETRTYDVPPLAPNQTWKKTRNESWSSPGNKMITLRCAFVPDGQGQIVVDGKYKVSALGAPTSSAGQNVKCSDYTVKQESDFQ